MNKANLSSDSLDVKESEEIPGPVTRLLDQWFQAQRGKETNIPHGAVTRTHAEKASWVPSSNRSPRFEDNKGRKLWAHLYSLRKWTRNDKNLVVVVWNDFQRPFIIRGPSSNLNLNSQSQETKKKFSCLVWIGIGDDINERGFAPKSFIYMVEDEKINCYRNGGYASPPHAVSANHTTITSSCSARTIPARPTSDSHTKSGPSNTTLLPIDPHEFLSDLPVRLHIMMENYYSERGFRQPPACATPEKDEPATAASGDRFVFLDHRRQEVAVERLPTGFGGYVFLLAEGNAIIRHPDGMDDPRVYMSWRGGLDFSANSTFERVVLPSTVPEEESRCHDTESNAQAQPRQVAPQISDHHTTSHSISPNPTVDNVNVAPSPWSAGPTGESPTPAFKRSPRSSVDLNNLPVGATASAQPKTQNFGHPDASHSIGFVQSQNRDVGEEGMSFADELMRDVHASQTPTATQQTSLSQLNFSSRSTPTHGAYATPFQRRESRVRDASLSSGLVGDFLGTVDMYIKDHVEIHFVASDGSMLRERPLSLCNNVPRLFSQAKVAFNWPKTTGRILTVKIPEVESPCAIVEGDKWDFEGFVKVLRDAKNWHLKDKDGMLLTIEVSEMKDEDDD